MRQFHTIMLFRLSELNVSGCRLGDCHEPEWAAHDDSHWEAQQPAKATTLGGAGRGSQVPAR